MSRKIIVVEVDELQLKTCLGLGLGDETSVNEAILNEAGWMRDSGIFAIEVRDDE
jgi:hypothetical protein